MKTLLCTIGMTWISLALQAISTHANRTPSSSLPSASSSSSGHPLKLEQECFPHLLTAASASLPKDYLHEDEYVTFIQLLCASNPAIPPERCSLVINPSQDPTFLKLDTLFIYTYNSLQCNFWCSVFNNGDNTCKCTNEGIPIQGARQEDDFNMKERQYLYEVCEESYQALYQVLEKYTPTPNPTASPTPGPTYDPEDNPIVTATAPFGLANAWEPPLRAVEVAEDRNDIKSDLENVLAELTLDILENDISVQFGNRRQLRLGSDQVLKQVQHEPKRRRLEISFERSYVTNIKDVECPNSIKVRYNNKATCQHMDGKVQIKVTDPSLREPIRSAIEESLLDAINSAKFFNALPPSQQEDLSTYPLVDPSPPTISFGAIIAISSGAALMGLFAGRALVLRRRKSDRGGREDGYGASNFPISPLADSSFGSAEDITIDKLPPTRQLSADSVGGSSSNAGSSGWSSSAGISSMNSESVGSGDYYGTSMAAITAASALHQQKYNKNSSKDNVTTYHIPAVEESSAGEDESDFESNLKIMKEQSAASDTKLDLNKAIQAGNWAAVGASAAILASTADSRSASSGISSGVGSLSGFSSGLSSGMSSNGGNSIQSERAAELDHLVEAGDWEGVVLAAAKFEAEPDKVDDSVSASGSEMPSGRSSADRSHAASSTTGMSASFSESQSNNVKRAEIRAEVEALVRRVVPDEIDNVDEMMNQFRGREEELLETLRSMQERAIAQRNREASRRNAKREARKVAKKSGGAGGLPPRGRMAMGTAVPVAPKSKDETGELDSTFSEADFSGRAGVATNSLNDTISLPSSNLSTSQTASRIELENAINDGNWQAVGETAARLGAASVSSTATSEFVSAGEESDYASVRSHLSRSERSTSSQSERALQLEALIDEGDWTGVVNAAKNYNASDMKSDVSSEKAGSDSSSDSKKWKLPFRRGRAANPETTKLMVESRKVNKEEEEALAQAQIWEAVAAQSKLSSEAKGASEAADWAISRSLRQIEQSSSKSRKDYASDSEANSVNDDDKSV